METGNLTVTVVGLGLIGGSMALGLKGKVGSLRGLDVSPEILREAAVRDMADRLGTDPRELLPGADLVVVALYPEQTRRFILENREVFSPGTLIMDVSGIKETLVRDLQAGLPDTVEFLGAHPMAGREGSGIRQAREEMFLGSYFLITPTERNTPEALGTASAVLELLGPRKIVELDPSRHDRLMAYTSQMPHVLAALLVDGFTGDSRFLLGGSFRDATRVASINEVLWSELFLENRDNLLEEVRAFRDRLDRFEQLLSAGDSQGLEQWLRKVREIRENIQAGEAGK